jgi:hypothetical protein
VAQSQHLWAISPVRGLARGASRIDPQREQEETWAFMPMIIVGGGDPDVSGP